MPKTFQDLLILGVKNLKAGYIITKKYDKLYKKKFGCKEIVEDCKKILEVEPQSEEHKKILNKGNDLLNEIDRLIDETFNQLIKKNITGLDSRDISEKDLKVLLEINKYVYTTRSVSPGEHFEDNTRTRTVNNDTLCLDVCLNFYTPKSIALKIVDYFQKLEKKYVKKDVYKYGIIVYHNDFLVRQWNDNWRICQDCSEENPDDFPHEKLKKYDHLFKGDDPLVCVLIRDSDTEDRSLFQVILNFFEKK